MSNLTQTKTQINHKSKYDPKIISIDETPTPQPSHPQQDLSHGHGPGPKRLKITPKCVACGKPYPSFNHGSKYDKTNLQSGEYCKDCKEPGMINVSKVLCKCLKTNPSYGEPRSKGPVCCELCKTSSMIELPYEHFNGAFILRKWSGKLSAGAKCHGQIDRECPHPSSRPSDFHHGFCLNCFEHNFPFLKKSRTLKTRNQKIK